MSGGSGIRCSEPAHPVSMDRYVARLTRRDNRLLSHLICAWSGKIMDRLAGLRIFVRDGEIGLFSTVTS